MRNWIFPFVILMVGLGGVPSSAQNAPSAFEQAQKLRGELSQLHDRKAEIEIRLTELDYELKPENIERHFAGVGSVHPEQLREARRKQLQLEKDRLVGQLSEIDQNQARLETEIQIADSKAFQQNAVGATSIKPQSRLAPLMTATVFRLGALTFALIVVGIVLIAAHRRQQTQRHRD